jgi:glutamine amidotransferase-like uncharacterized protein
LFGYESNYNYTGNYDYENYGAEGGDLVGVPVKRRYGSKNILFNELTKITVAAKNGEAVTLEIVEF